MTPWSLLCGAVVGAALGLTGGGGAVLAVPLLVYGLGLAPREAVGVSLVVVGGTALVGVVERYRQGLVETPTGLLFALSGMLGAPLGSWLAELLPEGLLLVLFAVLMLTIAVRMWRQAPLADANLPLLSADNDQGPTCVRDPQGRLRISSPCAALLAALGLATGVLSGLFGVGGGFMIVPALTTFTGMSLRRAVGTALLVIGLVSLAGVASHLAAGRSLSGQIIGPFLGGALGGLFAGSWASRRLSGLQLQRTFAVAIVAVAVFVLARNLG
jgi:hypothetical protein